MDSPTSVLDFAPRSYHDDLVLVGGGPRSAMQLNGEIVFMLVYQQHFDELASLGAHYDITTTIIETQSELGVGHSYSNGQTGMMNTGVEDDITFPVPIPSGSEVRKPILSLLSYKHRFEQFLKGNYKQYYNLVKSVNLPGAVMFRHSLGASSTSANGHLEHDRAYLLRTTVGMEESSTCKLLRSLAHLEIPFYKVRVLTSSWVQSILLNAKGMPKVVVKKGNSNLPLKLKATTVRLNCGTLSTNPVNEGSVRDLTFCESMNADRFRNFCASRDFLDSDGYLKAGVKVISGGMSLSGLDQISVLDYTMNLFEEDDSVLGYRVREEAKKKYQSAITLISRTTKNICLPRVSYTIEWQQGTPVLGNVKHLHALFLHNYGEEVCGMWMMIIRCAIARASRKTIQEAGLEYDSAEDHFRSCFEESMHHLKCRQRAGKLEKHGDMIGKSKALKESTRTLCGAWRQASLGTYFGFGLHSDAESVIDEMSNFAPITWKGREFMLFHRAQMAALTDPTFALQTSNEKYVRNWHYLMKTTIASPVEIHSMMHLLLEAGIAQHERASYGDIQYDSSAGKLNFRGTLHDTMIVSRFFERKRDEAAISVSSQVKVYDETNSSFGRVGKLRRFLDSQGNYVPVEEHGLGGKGFNTTASDGGRSLVGGFAWDVNNRMSGTAQVPSLTLRRMASAHLSAAGIRSPMKVIDDIYEKGKATNEAYSEEVDKFRPFFVEVHEICAYLQAITHASVTDAERFVALYDSGCTSGGRALNIHKLSTSEVTRDREAAEIYYSTVRSTPEFKPPSRDQYLARFVDMTDDEALYVYEESRKIARDNLMRRNKQ